MKTLFNIAMVLFIGVLTAIITVPADQECIKQVTADVPIIGEYAGQYIYDVQNKVLYKVIVNRITGQVVGYALFGQVITNR